MADVLLATSCPVCAALGPAPCAGCASRLRPAQALPCPPGLAGCRALLDYDGAGRELVARLKYRNARCCVPFLASGMAGLVASGRVDLVTWAPTTAARRRARGFDQSQVLARAVARRLGLPCRRLLRRRAGAPQTGKARSERWTGVRFGVLPRSGLIGARVLVVDDVITSGATVAAAARCLLEAGAAEVHALAAARARPGRVHSPMAVCGSVVASRGQSQAKRPT